MAEQWEELKGQIFSAIESRTADFLSKNGELKVLLLERSERLAKLVQAYLVTVDPSERKSLMDSADTVRQTIENQIDAAAANATAAGKALFKQVVGMAFDAIIKTLPAIMGAI